MGPQTQFPYSMYCLRRSWTRLCLASMTWLVTKDKIVHSLLQRFYWPDMEQDVRKYVKCCQRCTLSKTPEPTARAPLESINSSAPMGASRGLLVVTYHFTMLAHAFPCAKQTAKQVAKKLWDNVF